MRTIKFHRKIKNKNRNKTKGVCHYVGFLTNVHKMAFHYWNKGRNQSKGVLSTPSLLCEVDVLNFKASNTSLSSDKISLQEAQINSTRKPRLIISPSILELSRHRKLLSSYRYTYT